VRLDPITLKLIKVMLTLKQNAIKTH